MNDNIFTMLKMPDGKTRLTCTGCALYLHERGMLELVEEVALHASEVPKLDAATVRLYRLAPGVTIEDTQAAVKGRHDG